MIKIKQLITILVITLTIISCGNSSTENTEVGSFTINGKFEKLDYSKAYLANFKGGDFIKLDSANIKDGAFSFSGTVAVPNVKFILFDDSKEKIKVFVENSEIEITGLNLEKENIKIVGSEINTKLDVFYDNLNPYNDTLKGIEDEYYASKKAGNLNLLDSIEQKYLEQDSIKTSFIKVYVNENLNSAIAPYLTLKYLMDFDASELEQLTSGFANKIKKSEYSKTINELIELKKTLQIGNPAPLFSMNDKDGNPIALESFKGKYLLIDFWASWCGPCRNENPNVVAAYAKYHAKGFDILGVSLDKNKDKWLEAIEKDKLIWSHVSDLKYWDNAAAKLYNVRGIPYSVLIDKDGIIVAEHLSGKELHNKLEEIFAED